MQLSLPVLRKNRGLTQADLAESCGVSRALIGMVETGHMQPYPKLRRAIADALGVLPADIWPELEGEGGKK